jgi:hypothetical protein
MGKMEGTSERAQKKYNRAFDFPEFLPNEEKDALICLAVDVLNMLYGVSEDEYYIPTISKAADNTTIKLFESTLSENREIQFLEYVVTHMTNIHTSGKELNSSEKLFFDSIKYSVLPSICHGNMTGRTNDDENSIQPESHSPKMKIFLEYVNTSKTTEDVPITKGLMTFYAEEVEEYPGYIDFIMNKPKSTLESVQHLWKNINRVSAQSDDENLFDYYSKWTNFTDVTRSKKIAFVFPPLTYCVFKLIASPEYYGSQTIIDMYPRYKYASDTPVKFQATDDIRFMCFADLLIWYVFFISWKR